MSIILTTREAGLGGSCLKFMRPSSQPRAECGGTCLSSIIPVTWEAETGRNMVPGQPRTKKKNWAWWYASIIPATAGSINRRIMDQASLGEKARPSLKNNQSKRAGDIAHGVECLSSKYKALSKAKYHHHQKEKKKSSNGQ
jgi:hypothetical protein